MMFNNDAKVRKKSGTENEKVDFFRGNNKCSFTFCQKRFPKFNTSPGGQPAVAAGIRRGGVGG